jgi:membrane associated rhomboid family serine protease
VGVFLAYMLLDAPAWAPAHLALHPRRALWPEPWQLVTSGFFHPRALPLFFSAFTLWIFGSAVEQRLGTRRMITVFIGSQVAGAVAWAVAGLLLGSDVPLTGCGPGGLGLVAAFGVAYKGVPLSLFGAAQMKSRVLALILVGFAAVQSLLHGDLVDLAGLLVAAGVGWVLAGHRGINLAGTFASPWDKLRLWRLRRKYKVIQGGRTEKRYKN